MIPNKIVEVEGKIQLMNREWYEFIKVGWYKHHDIWGRRLWIRFNWPKEEEIKKGL